MQKMKAAKLKVRSVAEKVRGPRTEESFGFLARSQNYRGKKPKATEDSSTATRAIAL
jgi:hypothetical protein